MIPVVPFGELLYRKPSASPLAPTAPQVHAAVDFMLWMVSSPDSAPLLSADAYPPVAADAARQSAFWSTNESNEYRTAVGDWRAFRGCYDGFPTVPPNSVMYDTLSQVIAGNADLTTALLSPEQQMNAAVATPA